MEALVLDVKNYEAFRELVEGSMMAPDEGEFQIRLHTSPFSRPVVKLGFHPFNDCRTWMKSGEGEGD